MQAYDSKRLLLLILLKQENAPQNVWLSGLHSIRDDEPVRALLEHDIALVVA